MIEVKVSGLALDGSNNTPVVLLKERNGERVLPIWIGAPEANAIAMALEGIRAERPLTHDLMVTLIEGLEGKVSKIIISDLKDNTFYAKIYVQAKESIVNIDARPSDSIALALRVKVPIYVSEDVMTSSGTTLEIDDETKARALREYLERLNPEDFGKYKI